MANAQAKLSYSQKLRRNELLIEERLRLCRDDFALFRRTVNPKDKWGWFQEEVAAELQAFFERLQAGEKPKMVIEAPPQHGKSVQIVDFIAWLAGKNPDLRTIYTSFSERLGIRANLRLQRLYDSEVYQRIFPDTFINASNIVSISGQYLRNRDILEYVGRTGYFRNTTVQGRITGESLDLGVIDDPVKGRAAANSLTQRDGAWEWFTDDFFTRFSEDAGLLCILTRWHIDDPIGRLISKYPQTRVLKYQAIADNDEPHRKAGEPLFPELKSLDFLMERKAMLDKYSWLSLYQQTPVIAGGELIKGVWFKRYNVLPPIKQSMIFGDTAQKTKQHNDYSVFELWGEGTDGMVYLIDMIRGKWEAPELTRRAIDFWNKHSSNKALNLRKLMVEDKVSGTGLIQEIRARGKIPVFGIQRNIDKYTRVADAMPHIESGYVYIPEEAPFVADFITECEAFTADNSHAFDDQVDPMCDAIKTFLQSTVRGFFT